MKLYSVLFSVFTICALANCDAKKYKCVFGFSTGHVGTGTLNEKTAYKNVSHVEFLFEGYSTKEDPVAKSQLNCRVSSERYKAGNFTELDEEYFVKRELSYFFNALIQSSNKRIIVDLGHSNLFYYRGLARHFLDPNKARPFCSELVFVRIRRSRYETAKSLMYRSPHHPKTDLCADVVLGYCPYMNPSSVLIRPISQDAWKNLSVFQQMLWFIDETEARWRHFKQKYTNSNIVMSEVYWSSKESEGLERALPTIARILETEPANIHLPQHHVHANILASKNEPRNDNANQIEEKNALAERGYRDSMNFDVSIFS